MNNDPLLDVAAALADGTAVDWESAARSITAEDDRRLLAELRFIGGIARPPLTPPKTELSTDSWGPPKIVEHVGRGSFGDVYRAWDSRLDREVALKLLRHTESDDEAHASTVIQEGRLLAFVSCTDDLLAVVNNLSMFQSIDGEHREVPGHYIRRGPDVIGFEIDDRYDSTRPLIIDPVVAYATYIGGINEDRGVAVAIDHHGNAYLTGRTASLNFPTQDPQQPASGGDFDAFIAKFTADGSALEYSTYFGGSGFEQGFGIAVDENGSAYVSGQTGSANMPISNALQPTYGGGVTDAFVLKLDPTGAQLWFSTFLGGSSDERALDCRLDASGAIYIAGSTASADFPTAAAVQPSLGGMRDAFLTKMDSAGSTLLFSTYLGGSGAENICALAVDLAGRAAVVGKTSSINFPLANAVQPTYGEGTGDVFVSRFNETGSSFIYSTYLGGSGDDQGFSAAVTRSGEVIAGGNSASTNYPLVNPLQSTMAGVRDLVITKLDKRGRIVFSTYLGGTANENAFGLGVDPPGNVYFAGFTASPNFPLSSPIQSTISGPMDAIFGKISAGGDSLIFSTYFGGSGADEAGFLAVDPRATHTSADGRPRPTSPRRRAPFRRRSPARPSMLSSLRSRQDRLGFRQPAVLPVDAKDRGMLDQGGDQSG